MQMTIETGYFLQVVSVSCQLTLSTIYELPTVYKVEEFDKSKRYIVC